MIALASASGSIARRCWYQPIASASSVSDAHRRANVRVSGGSSSGGSWYWSKPIPRHGTDRCVPGERGLRRVSGLPHANAGAQAFAHAGLAVCGVQAAGSHAQQRDELSGVLERVGDHAAVFERDGGGGAAVDLADERGAGEGALAVELGEAVGAGYVADDVGVGGEHCGVLPRGSSGLRRGSSPSTATPVRLPCVPWCG